MNKKQQILPNYQATISKAPIDFENDETKAHDWGEENFGDWHDKLSHLEKNALLQYTKRSYEAINKFLFITNGNYENEEQKIDVNELSTHYTLDELKKQIALISKALSKIKTTETLIVYRRINVNYFDEKLANLREANSSNINVEIFEQLAQRFTNYQVVNHGFLSASLTSNLKSFAIAHRKMPLLMKIIVPKNTHCAFLSGWGYNNFEKEIIIQHGYKLKYENFAIIRENNKEIVKVIASLII